MPVQVVPVQGGNIPQPPAGAVVTEHSRNAPPSAIPMQPPAQVADPLAGLVQPAPQPQQPITQPQPAAAQPGIDPQLLQLLAGLTQAAQPAQAQPTAPAPAPAPSPQGEGLEGALKGMLATAGVDVDRALANALEYGNANLIDFAHIREKAGANAAQFEAVARSLVETAVAAERQQLATIHAMAGGEQNFNAAVAAFKQSAPAHVQTIVTALADSGNDEAVKQGIQIMLQYSTGAVVQQPSLVQAGAGAAIAAGLGRDAFQAELQKLDRSSPQYEAARQELFARRAFGKSQGL